MDPGGGDGGGIVGIGCCCCCCGDACDGVEKAAKSKGSMEGRRCCCCCWRDQSGVFGRGRAREGGRSMPPLPLMSAEALMMAALVLEAGRNMATDGLGPKSFIASVTLSISAVFATGFFSLLMRTSIRFS